MKDVICATCNTLMRYVPTTNVYFCPVCWQEITQRQLEEAEEKISFYETFNLPPKEARHV